MEATNTQGKEILSFVRINNDLKYLKFKSTELGGAFEEKLNDINLSHEDKREVVITSKNQVLALILKSSVLNKEALQENTATATQKANEELNAFTSA